MGPLFKAYIIRKVKEKLSIQDLPEEFEEIILIHLYAHRLMIDPIDLVNEGINVYKFVQGQF